MTQKRTSEFVKGYIYWAKVLGSPRPNYGGDAREWAFDLSPDDAGKAIFKKHKLTDRLKDKDDERGLFITLKKKELNKEGEKNKPIRVYNSEDEAWDEEQLIGNKSEVVVKLDIVDYGPGKKAGIYPQAIKVLDLVEFKSNEFGGYNDTADKTPPKKVSASKTKDFEKDFGLEEDPLDDEIAF